MDVKDRPEWFEEFQRAKAAKGSGQEERRGGSERRRHARFDVDLAIVELDRGGLGSLLGLSKRARVEGAVLDLSEGGLRAQVREQMPPNSRFRCRVRMVKFQESFEAIGETRWCREEPAKGPGSFQIGIRFEKLGAPQSKKIAAMRNWFASTEYRAHKDRRLGGSAG